MFFRRSTNLWLTTRLKKCPNGQFFGFSISYLQYLLNKNTIMNLHDGILRKDPRKMTVKVKDDFLLKDFLWLNEPVFASAVKNIFEEITYSFEHRKHYKKFLELYDITMHAHNFKEKYYSGHYDHLLPSKQ